jgi:hypothetical protein
MYFSALLFYSLSLASAAVAIPTSSIPEGPTAVQAVNQESKLRILHRVRTRYSKESHHIRRRNNTRHGNRYAGDIENDSRLYTVWGTGTDISGVSRPLGGGYPSERIWLGKLAYLRKASTFLVCPIRIFRIIHPSRWIYLDGYPPPKGLDTTRIIHAQD